MPENNYILTSDGELYHYGVPGMKWGVRKAGYISTYRGHKNARKARRTAYDESAKASGAKKLGPLYVHKNVKSKIAARKAGNKAYRESIKKDVAYNRDRRKKLKGAYGELVKNASGMDKFLHGKSTHKKAAKFMVDNNMTMKKAKEKAYNEHNKNVNLMVSSYLAVSGALTVARIMSQFKITRR